MKLELTLGMGGKTVIDFGKFKNKTDLQKAMLDFLNDPSSKLKYKIEKYQTIHNHPEKNEIIIDFGDYTYFLKISY